MINFCKETADSLVGVSYAIWEANKIATYLNGKPLAIQIPGRIIALVVGVALGIIAAIPTALSAVVRFPYNIVGDDKHLNNYSCLTRVARALFIIAFTPLGSLLLGATYALNTSFFQDDSLTQS